MKITLMIKKDEDKFLIGQLKEFPQVISEGATKDELLENIGDALETYLEFMRDENSSVEDSNIEEQDVYRLNACQ